MGNPYRTPIRFASIARLTAMSPRALRTPCCGSATMRWAFIIRCAEETRNVGPTRNAPCGTINEKGPPSGRPFDGYSNELLSETAAPTRCARSLGRTSKFWDLVVAKEHKRAGRVSERADDVERGASAIGLLQGPVTHVQLQPEQHAIILGSRAKVIVVLGLRALILGKHGERRRCEPPLALHTP